MQTFEKLPADVQSANDAIDATAPRTLRTYRFTGVRPHSGRLKSFEGTIEAYDATDARDQLRDKGYKGLRITLA